MPPPRIFQLVGTSGSGKTLAIEKTVRLLRKRSLRVAVLKHSHHPLDVPGKDTARLRRSGADPVLFASQGWALFAGGDPRLLLSLLPVDVVLVEGYHQRTFPGNRYAIDKPSQAAPVALEVSRRVPDPTPHRRVRVDGREAPDNDLWRFIANVMEHEGIRKVESRGPGRLRAHTTRSRRAVPRPTVDSG